ncbi:MAG: acetate--CoA ligase family protein, partial [Deltaproteobacteria bacterium]|nr:acetate--CoA ligase family protein [Deltaproteobacteria bacterium]
MSKIPEYQGKELLRKAGVKVPDGEIATSPEEAKAIAQKIGKPVVLKAQVLATGRYDAGGVKFAEDPDEAFAASKEMLGKRIKEFLVKQVLVEERLNLEHEYYAGIVVDTSIKVKAPVLVFSTEGGTGIEEVAARNPERVKRLIINPLNGLGSSDVDSILQEMNVTKASEQINSLICGIYGLFKEADATSVEINPFVLTKEGEVYAADCHVTIDDNSVFKHPELGIKVPRDMDREPTALEQLAWDQIEEGDYRGTGYFAQMVTEYDKNEKYVGFHGIGGG